MYWTLELASYLEDAPWPATKDELIDYSIRSGAPMEVVENLQELEDDGHFTPAKIRQYCWAVLYYSRKHSPALSIAC